MTKKFKLFLLDLCLLLMIYSVPEFVRGQEFLPAEEQEFIEAKEALEEAQKAQAEKYASEPLNQARDFLGHSREGPELQKRR